jgi:hypothetical protein
MFPFILLAYEIDRSTPYSTAFSEYFKAIFGEKIKPETKTVYPENKEKINLSKVQVNNLFIEAMASQFLKS